MKPPLVTEPITSESEGGDVFNSLAAYAYPNCNNGQGGGETIEREREERRLSIVVGNVCVVRGVGGGEVFAVC